MSNFFEEPEDRVDGSTMSLGHHRVTVSTMRKSGEPRFKDTPKGPRLQLVLTDVADRSQSTLDGQTFNLTCKGMMASLNKALGATAAELSGMISNPDGITDSGFPANDAAKIASFWDGRSGWCEVTPNSGYDYPNVRWLSKEPGTKKAAGDYTAVAASSGSSGGI